MNDTTVHDTSHIAAESVHVMLIIIKYLTESCNEFHM
jgi:hypothetical protein